MEDFKNTEIKDSEPTSTVEDIAILEEAVATSVGAPGTPK
jgi:hypothetical protein